MSPTALTLRRLRKLNYICGVVEKVVPYTFTKQDFLGCIDILAFKRGESGVLGIQATSLSNVPARRNKAKKKMELEIWLAADNRYQIWGWSKPGPFWEVKIEEFTGVDCEPVVVEKPARRLVSRHKQQELF